LTLSIVVSDTSPIRALNHLGRLALLHDLFGEVIVPTAVVEELSLPGDIFPSISLRDFSFIRIESVKNPELVQRLMATLDRGESEALALAVELHASAVLIDESLGRKKAMQMGFIPVGVLGILLQAKKAGLIGLVEPLLEKLENEIHFFMSAELRTQVLRMAGE
jgi:predicted nucleic acid-binding protein